MAKLVLSRENPIIGHKAMKVVLTKKVLLGDVELETDNQKIDFQDTEHQVHVIHGVGIYDAQVNADKLEVRKLTEEVRTAHTHIHQDKASVETSEANALLYAQAADEAATDSETSASTSHQFAQESLASKNAAKTSEINAKSSETKSKTSETNAKASETKAKTSEVNAKASEVAADQSEANALASKNAAASSATTATTQAGIATDKANIATTKASEASTSASNALTSERNAKASENASKASEIKAADSEDIAIEKAGVATTQAGIATTKASESLASANKAKTSETNAKTSETNALNHKNSASASATASANSAADSLESQENATASEAAALASKNAAKTSETNANASKNAAASSASTASTKASEAAISANKAKTSETNAKASEVAAKASELKAAEYAATLVGSILDGGSVDLSSGQYPAVPKHSTFWKVTKGGTVSGIDYGVGDTLVYSKASGFYKIDSTESVTSVNGMKGVVNLNAGHVGAVNKAGDTMTGKLTIPNIELTGKSIALEMPLNSKFRFKTSGLGWDIYEHSASGNLRFRTHTNGSEQQSANEVSFDANRVSSTSVPTANSHLTNKLYVDGKDAQNVKLTGSQTITGGKTISVDGRSVTIKPNTNTNTAYLFFQDHGGQNRGFFGHNQPDTDFVWNNYVGSSFVQTPTGKNVFLSSPRTLNTQESNPDSLTRKDYVDSNLALKVDKKVSELADGRVNTWNRSYVVSNTKIAKLVDGDGALINTHGLYRVTANTLGTGTSTGTVAIFVKSGDNWTLRTIARGGSGSNHPEFLIHEGRPAIKTSHANDYTVQVITEQKVTGNSNNSALMAGLESYFYLNSAGTMTLNGSEFYTTDHKPTPSEIGAYTKSESDSRFVNTSGDSMTGWLHINKDGDAFDALKMGSARPWSFRIAGAQGESGIHLVSHVDTKTFRVGHKDTVTSTPALEVHVRGGNGDGQYVNLRYPTATTPQGTGANHLTRKDYVNSEDNKRVSKSGDTMTGELTVPVLNVGNKSNDRHGRLYILEGDNILGFTAQHKHALVAVNEQGATNQAIVLSDSDDGTGSTIFGVSARNSSGSWNRRLNLHGNGELYIGNGTKRVYHEGHKPTLDEVQPLTTISKTLTVNNNWIDTGIEGNHLSSGSYMVQLSVNDSATGFYSEIFTGTMSWYSGGTNSDIGNEFLLHNAGHSDGGKSLHLRTLRQRGSKNLKLQISASTSLPSSSYTFKFRRLI